MNSVKQNITGELWEEQGLLFPSGRLPDTYSQLRARFRSKFRSWVLDLKYCVIKYCVLDIMYMASVLLLQDFESL